MSVLTHQPKVTSLIQKAIKQGKLSHAYLFAGEPGVGKEQIALWMAKQFFCKDNGIEGPCNECSECKRIDSMNHPDLHFLEPDGQSIKIDQIRSLQKEFHYKGVESNKKCYIIKHVDKMTVQAANSLLKFLEEPNGQSLAILITENKHRLLDTIISRVQMYQFQPLKEEDVLSSFLNKGIEGEVATLLSKVTKSVSKGEELLEEEWFLEAKELLFATLQQFLESPFDAIITMQTEWPVVFSDKEKQQISLNLFTVWFREVVNIGLNREIRLEGKKSLLESYKRQFSVFHATEMIEHIIEGRGMLRSNANYVMVLERISNSLLECTEK